MPTKRIKAEYRTLKAAPPGRRFVDAHERHRIDNHALRILVILLGLVILVGGAATFWLPGPQVVIVLIGLVLMASQWRVVARLLDWIEVTGRGWNDQYWDPYPHKTRAKVLLALAFAAGVGLIVWIAWAQDWIPGWVPILGTM